MPFRRVLAFACLALLSVAAPAAEAQTFVFHLSGDQEVPPVPSMASGGCHGDYDAMANELDLICVHDVELATLIHVHRAAAGANGPPVFDLGDPTSPVVATWTGLTPQDVADLMAGELYVNIHTGGRPDGEIRGQVLPRTVDTVAFGLDGAQVVPPVFSPAIGSCTADLDDPGTGVAVECSHDVASPTEAHLHDGPPGTNGPLVFDFGAPASPFSGTAPLTPAQVASFAAGFLYVDVHSTDAPSGEIRGRAAEVAAGTSTGTIRIAKVTYPAGGTGFSFTDDVPGSSGAFALDDGGTEVFTAVPPGTYTVTEMDPGALPGDYALTELDCSDADSTADRASRTATVQLEAGETVVCTFVNTRVPPGAVRFAFHLSGDQEVPSLASPSRGGCAGLLDAGAAELTLLCTHDVTDATVMHVHRGAAGVNGPVVFDLGDPTSPVQATWSGISPMDLADLLAGNLYVNIHTSGRPTGEIRGQILPRTIETWDLVLSGQQVAPPGPSPFQGSCFAALDDDATGISVGCDHTMPDPVAAHVHAAPAGLNGPVIFTFPDPTSPFAAFVPLTLRDLADLLAGFLYLDVHGSEESGELRAQIVPEAPALNPLEVPVLDAWGLLVLGLALAAAAWRLAGR